MQVLRLETQSSSEPVRTSGGALVVSARLASVTIASIHS